ncbi:hypothetical protein H072_5391 [Dactylellina haptotyla CBS 200.50]|uniref:Uncharacterized protein n=1 Tax=Dactylellina haptotyla (strain CBS 200.50) TaxID=1284197 RepID=S8ACM2_DACHA|nr:hypothetical protein H072_5391 [Dactylellina haptotyla CBS 200.50]
MKFTLAPIALFSSLFLSKALALPAGEPAKHLEKRASLNIVVCTDINSGGTCLPLDITDAQRNQCINFAASWNDKISSLAIGTTSGWSGCQFYKDWYCVNAILPAPVGSHYWDLRNADGNDRNDMISSFRCL